MSQRENPVPDAASKQHGLRLNAAILIGGASQRMRYPKAALVHNGQRLLDIAINLVKPLARSITLVGRKPEGVDFDWSGSADSIPAAHLHDDPSTSGPLAGIAAALARDPQAHWLCLSCDMPGLTHEAIGWLLDQHGPHNTATVGALPGCSAPEPFPAIYGPNAAEPMRSFIRSGGTSLRGALASMDACVRPVPPQMINCWQNVNTPQEWARFSSPG